MFKPLLSDSDNRRRCMAMACGSESISTRVSPAQVSATGIWIDVEHGAGTRHGEWVIAREVEHPCLCRLGDERQRVDLLAARVHFAHRFGNRPAAVSRFAYH
jgi:hypothetical protein